MDRNQRRWSSAAGTVPGPSSTSHGPRGRGVGEGYGATERSDAWWLQPVAQATALVLLGAYATWAALQGHDYQFTAAGRHYLSPLYSPLFKPRWWPWSPALLVLVGPGGFRATCYYYRKAYYRAFFLDPHACAVGEPRKSYFGETKFPFILQNLHRYFMYFALVFIWFLWVDVFHSVGGAGGGVPGIYGGSLVLLASTGSLTAYLLSCHSLRHLIGGKVDCFSCVAAGGPRHRGWSFVSFLNGHHMGLAWWSLVAVCFADFYVRMCSMGVLHDPVFITFRHLFEGGMIFGP